MYTNIIKQKEVPQINKKEYLAWRGINKGNLKYDVPRTNNDSICFVKRNEYICNSKKLYKQNSLCFWTVRESRNFSRSIEVHRDSASNLEDRFQSLYSEWKKETNHMSLISNMVVHPAYQQIIGMGDKVIPLILQELRKEPDHWFWALRAITGENPVKPEDKGKIRKMAEAWFDWGRQHGYKC